MTRTPPQAGLGALLFAVAFTALLCLLMYSVLASWLPRRHHR